MRSSCKLLATLIGTALSGLGGLLPASAQQPAPFVEVPFAQLTDRQLTAYGRAALEIRAADWKHAESANFVYHFFQSFIAAPVSVEAEAYYRMIAADLDRDTARWERKCHVFIFEAPQDWAEFKKARQLDPWTGGLHYGGELFIVRNPAQKFKGSTLAHEIAHLVVHRFFGPGVPLWLNEGYAEFAASRFHAAYFRARGYLSKPRSAAVTPENFLPLSVLLGQADYGSDPVRVAAFYDESEKLVRFLSAADRRGFAMFFEAMSHGSRFDTALAKGFGSRFPSESALERDFKAYATRDSATASAD